MQCANFHVDCEGEDPLSSRSQESRSEDMTMLTLPRFLSQLFDFPGGGGEGAQKVTATPSRSKIDLRHLLTAYFHIFPRDLCHTFPIFLAKGFFLSPC